MTRAEIRELLRELKKYAIKLSVDDYRVKLSGGNLTARDYYQALIDGDEEIQAMLILEHSKNDPDLRYDIEERASIVWVDGGGEYDLLGAVKMNMNTARINEEWRLSHGAGAE